LLLIKEKLPKTKVFIQSILPTDNRENLQTIDVISINEGLRELAVKHQMTFVNLFEVFRADKNKLNTDYTIDGLHLNGEGYLIWKMAIDKCVNNKRIVSKNFMY
jgi:lysophospholipase L1-like esterase